MADQGQTPLQQGIDVGSLPPLAPVTGVAEQLAGMSNRFAGPGSRWDQIVAKMGINSIEDAPEALLGRHVAELALAYSAEKDGDKKWSPEQLNSYFGKEGYTERFVEPEFPSIAMMRVDQWRKRREVDEYVGRGKPWGTGFELLTGAPQALSPINILAGRGAGWGAKKLMGLVGSQIGKAGLGRAGLLFAENAVGNLAVDVPAYEQMKEEGTSATRTDVALGSLAGAILGTGLHLGLGAIKNRLAPRDVETRERQLNQAIAESESGAKIQPAPAGDNRFMGASREAGDSAGGAVTGTPYSKPAHPSEVPFFVNVDSDGKIMSTGEHGDGIYAADSAFAKNNKGDFIEVKPKKDSKFLDLEDQLSDPNGKEFYERTNEHIKKNYGIEHLDMPERSSLSDVRERLEIEEDAGNLPDGVTAEKIMREVAQDLKYSGFSETYRVNGEARHNRLTAFDESALERGNKFLQNQDLVPKISAADAMQRHQEYVSKMENKNTYNPEVIRKLNKIRSRPTMTAVEIQTELKQFEVRTRADLKKLLAKASSEEQLDLIPNTKQGELGLPSGRLDIEDGIEYLQATQALYDDVMRQIDEFIESDDFNKVVKNITDDELGRMKQAEIEGLRGTATQKPVFRRSNLPDKDTLARMSAEEYRASIQKFADDQPELFATHYYGAQQELDLKPMPPIKTGPRGRIMTSDEMANLYLAVQQHLPMGEGRVTRTIVPPEAPTPQTPAVSRVVNGERVETKPIPESDLKQASKNLKEVNQNEELKQSLTEQMKMNEQTKKIIQDKEMEIEKIFKASKSEIDLDREVITCVVGSLS